MAASVYFPFMFVLLGGFLWNSVEVVASISDNTSDYDIQQNFHSYHAMTASGDNVPLSKYKGKVTLVVNVASECGFTDGHYKGLIRLKNVLSTGGKFEVLAFPCNQFGQQEPGSNEEVQEFVTNTYHVNFPVFAKIDVLGDFVPDSWKFLISSFGQSPNWNFWKYLVNDKGELVNAWGPRTPVEDIYHDVKEVIDNIGYTNPSYVKITDRHREDNHGEL